MHNKRKVLRLIRKDHLFLMNQAKLYEKAQKLIRKMLGDKTALGINIPYKLTPLMLHGMMVTIKGVEVNNVTYIGDNH